VAQALDNFETGTPVLKARGFLVDLRPIAKYHILAFS